MNRAVSQWCQALTKKDEQCLAYACGAFEFDVRDSDGTLIKLKRRYCRTHYLQVKRLGYQPERIK